MSLSFEYFVLQMMTALKDKAMEAINWEARTSEVINEIEEENVKLDDDNNFVFTFNINSTVTFVVHDEQLGRRGRKYVEAYGKLLKNGRTRLL